jgi:hypothetical protein
MPYHDRSLAALEAKVAASTDGPIDEMTFEDIARYFAASDVDTTVRNGSALTQRLYFIALYENHIPEKHREGALELLNLHKQTMEAVYTHSPEALRKYREANAYLEDNAKLAGVGSLGWLVIENEPMSDDEFVDFITRPEYRDLLPNFCANLAPSVFAKVMTKLSGK